MENECKWVFKQILPFLIASLLIIIVNTQIIMINYIPSESMEPTLKTGDYTINSRCVKDVQREDIVIFEESDRYMIKRVIGLPGETVKIKDNQVYINDKLLECPYIKEPMDTKDMIVKVPEDTYFLMGDNRNHSWDSRYLGVVSKEQIVAKNIF